MNPPVGQIELWSDKSWENDPWLLQNGRSWKIQEQSLVHLEMCCYMLLFFFDCPKFFLISEMPHSCCLHHPCLCWLIAYTNSNSIKTYLRCLNHKSHVSVFIDKAAIKTSFAGETAMKLRNVRGLERPRNAPPLPLPGRYWEVPRPANTWQQERGSQGSDTVLGCNFHTKLSPWKCHSSVTETNLGSHVGFQKIRGYNNV